MSAVDIEVRLTDYDVVLSIPGQGGDRHVSYEDALLLLERLAEALPDINNAAARVLAGQREKLRGQLDAVESRLARLGGATRTPDHRPEPTDTTEDAPH